MSVIASNTILKLLDFHKIYIKETRSKYVGVQDVTITQVIHKVVNEQIVGYFF